MTQLFETMYNMSFSASICVLLIILVRFLWKKMPKMYSYLLWGIVAIRLICPVLPESNFSIYHWLEDNVHYETKLYSVYNVANVTTSGIGYDISSKLMTISYIPYLWLSVTVILLLVSMLQYFLLCRKLRKDVTLQELFLVGSKPISVWRHNAITTAFITGITNPKIYLPKHLSEEENAFCLQHETMHIKRKDYLIKQFAYLLVCIYWFNPIIWIAYALMIKDMEMSCDEMVIGKGEVHVRKNYSNTLLNVAAPKIWGNGLPAFGENNIKSRIKNIMNYKRTPLLVHLCCVACIILLSTVMLTNNPYIEPFRGSFTMSDVNGNEYQYCLELIGTNPTNDLKMRFTVYTNNPLLTFDEVAQRYFYDTPGQIIWDDMTITERATYNSN